MARTRDTTSSRAVYGKREDRYLELVRQFPPDQAPERFAAVHAAYDALRDPARRLLAHTGDNVTSICFAAGFESLGSFSWLFRRRFGVSPRSFRENWRENRRIEEVFPSTAA